MRVARPSATWVSPQPCQIGKNDPYTYFDVVEWTSPTGASACGVFWQISHDDHGFANPTSNFFFPDDPPTKLYTRWSTGNPQNYQWGPTVILLIPGAGIPGLEVKEFTLEITRQSQHPPNVLSAGYYMVALDTAGRELARADFDAGVPVSQRTLAVSGIAKVLLYPVTSDDGSGPLTEGASYRASFAADTTCPPTGDPVLDTKAVRDGLKQALANSNPNATPGSGQKREHGGIVWRDANGNFYTQEVPDPNATECSFHTTVFASVPIPPGAQAEAFYHTHPSGKFEPTYGCGSGWAAYPGDGLRPAAADPDDPKAGGGSPLDWKQHETPGDFPDYVITKTGRVYKLDNQWYNNRSKNPNKYSTDTMGCPVKQP